MKLVAPYPSTVIGLDVGHSAVKVVADRKGQSRTTLTMPSAVSVAHTLHDELACTAAEVETVIVNGTPYWVGATASLQGIASKEAGLNESWINDPQYAALILGSLKALKAKDKAIHAESAIIACGLPAKLFPSQRMLLKQSMQRLLPDATIFVLPQPFGAYISSVFAQDGSVCENHSIESESWGVVEIGHFTTDIALIDKGLLVERASMSTHGAHIVAERLAALVLSERGYSLPLLEATQAVFLGQIKEFGQRVDLSPLIAQASTGLIDDVMGHVARVLDTHARTLDGILVAGGAAPLLFSAIQSRYRHAVLLDNARMSVAEGYCRFGCAYRSDMRTKHERRALLAQARSARSSQSVVV